jgi:pimeloyl-ACP methyl ester carboxylesterase
MLFLAAIRKHDLVLNLLHSTPKKIMQHPTINDANLWHDTLGKSELLLLHHGYTANREHWLPVAKILKQHYQVVIIECRGSGDSEHIDSASRVTVWVVGLV